ncbi:MAG: hypothetical protein RL441_1411, partial [Actinomycetota bacterium]
MRAVRRRFSAVVGAATLSMSLLTPALAATPAPVVSGFSVGPAEWVTSSAPLTIQASFSKAGTYDVVLSDVCHST